MFIRCLNALTRALVILSFLLCACTGDPKFDQYYAEGEKLYLTHCANCHQRDGKGLGLVYPPLALSDFVDQRTDDVLCLMKSGWKGEMVVNGEVFNQPMPGIPSLTDLEIAEIATYLYNTWGRKKGLIDVKQAGESLKSCHDR